MSKPGLTPRTALILFIAITVVLFAQAIWWIMFMARLVDEKVDMAVELGAGPDYIEQVHDQEIHRQIMIGMEGVFFLVLVGVGAWFIYRALVKTEELKFHQQNFLMAVTHELKTPLASISIYLDTMQSGKVPLEKKQEIIPRIKSDVIRLEKMVENVLEAGRFERSGYTLDREEFDFTRLVHDLITEFERYPSRVPVRIHAGAIDPDVRIDGDSRALRRAVEAVLENSVKYNDKETIDIQISMTRERDTIFLTISDNGIGLMRRDTDQIFNRFYRVGKEMTRSKPGTGLGLYLCREIIKAHGGQISADSEGPGKGVTFSIQLRSGISDENNTAR